MAFKFDKSREGHQSNLALFTSKPVDTGVESIQYTEYRPVAPISHGSSIEFNIPGSGMEYIDLSKTRLRVKVRILKASSGEPVTAADKVTLVNLPLQSLWRQVDVSLQQIVVTPTISTCYPYKALMDVLLNNSEDRTDSELQSQLFYKDTAGFMDNTDPEQGMNLGLVERHAWTQNGNDVDLEGPLYVDIMRQKRLLLNGVQVNIVLYPSPNPFALMAVGDDYRYDITDAVLKVCMVKVNSGVLVGHNEALKVSDAIYPFMRTDMKSYSIPSGLYTWSIDDPFLGQVPSRVIVALCSSAGAGGRFDKNPFNFANMNVNFVGFYVDDESKPAKPFQPNYKNNNYSKEYLSLFTGTGRYQTEGINISREDFKQGYSFYVFDIDGNHSEEFVSLSKRGHTRLALQFSEALAEPITLIAYASFPATLQVTLERNVKVN